MSDNPITPDPYFDALHALDAELGTEPHRITAQRIAAAHGFLSTDVIVDDIHNAIEDAERVGERRGALAVKWGREP